MLRTTNQDTFKTTTQSKSPYPQIQKLKKQKSEFGEMTIRLQKGSIHTATHFPVKREMFRYKDYMSFFNPEIAEIFTYNYFLHPFLKRISNFLIQKTWTKHF